MKVIFLDDVPNVARAGDTKEVANGYGRNYLLPRKLAVLANSQASTVVEAQLKKLAKQRAQNEAEMAALAGKLNGIQVTLKSKAGPKDRLYGSITSADIADELNKSAGVVVDKRKIEMTEPIHKLGNYDVPVKFTHDITAVLKVTILGEGGEVASYVEEVKAEEKVEAKVEEIAEVKAKAVIELEAAEKAAAKAAKAEEKARKAAERAAARAEIAAKTGKTEKTEKKTKVKAAKPEAEAEKPEAPEEKKPRVKAEKKTKKKVEEKAEGAGEKET